MAILRISARASCDRSISSRPLAVIFHDWSIAVKIAPSRITANDNASTTSNRVNAARLPDERRAREIVREVVQPPPLRSIELVCGVRTFISSDLFEIRPAVSGSPRS